LVVGRIEMPFQIIETGGPQMPVGLEPLVDRAERIGAHPVQASLSVHSHLDEPGFAQDPQVLGDRRLAQLEPLHELAHAVLRRSQEIEDPAAVGLRQDFEYGHRG